MKTQIKKTNLIEILALLILMAGIFCSAGFYVCQVNGRAASTVEISRLDKKVSNLEREIEELKVKSARMQSIAALEEQSQKMGMAQVSSAEFSTISSAMARR